MRRLELDRDLRRAIERRELTVHYQPIVDLATGELHEVEALVRWQHPERGLVSPAEFIPLAEETGLILPLSEQVMEAACRQMVAWQRNVRPNAPLLLCVNLSARQFRQPRLVESITRLLGRHGLAPTSLKLEITESLLMEDVTTTIETLQELRRRGVQIAIDDFGTGYSSLAYLRRFPVDVLKIDRAFVHGLGENEADRELVRAIVAAAKALRLRIIAEGIETVEQLRELQSIGCDLGQGYLFAKPSPPETITRLLATGRSLLPA